MLKLAAKNTASFRITGKMHGIASLADGQRCEVKLVDNSQMELVADETPQKNPGNNDAVIYSGKLRARSSPATAGSHGTSAAVATHSVDSVKISSRIVEKNGSVGQHKESGEGHGRGDVIRTLEDTVTLKPGAGKSEGDLFGAPVDFEENKADANQESDHERRHSHDEDHGINRDREEHDRRNKTGGAVTSENTSAKVAGK